MRAHFLYNQFSRKYHIHVCTCNMLWPRSFKAQKKLNLNVLYILLYAETLEWTTLSGVTMTHGLISRYMWTMAAFICVLVRVFMPFDFFFSNQLKLTHIFWFKLIDQTSILSCSVFHSISLIYCFHPLRNTVKSKCMHLTALFSKEKYIMNFWFHNYYIFV